MNAESIFLSILENKNENYDSIQAKVAYDNAVSAVKKYINNPKKKVEEEFKFQIVNLALYYYDAFKSLNMSSMSQGSRNISFIHDIPNEIKKTLPRYARIF